MPNWDDSVARISASREGPKLRSGPRWFWISRLPPVPVLGASGAGKTELWRLFTGRSAKDELSLQIDEAYYFGETKRLAQGLIAIPGQLCTARRENEERFFGNGATAIAGVIFVACYGYNFIWPKRVEAVANDLSEVSAASLSDRNSNEELTRFEDTCRLITEKWNVAASDKVCPKWLLVVCNKVDLYWDEINTAKGYYSYGSGSAFDHHAKTLVGNLAGAGFTYHVLPAAMTPRDYTFESARGTLRVASTLTPDQCHASLSALVDKLGELSGRK